MEIVIILAYTVWAIYSGWKITTRRIPALNKPGTGYKVGKIAVSIVIGYVFGAFYFLFVILSLLGFIQKNL